MRVYTVAEVADILRVNKNKVYALINEGEISHLKLGSIKVPDYELERFIREQVKGGASANKKTN